MGKWLCAGVLLAAAASAAPRSGIGAADWAIVHARIYTADAAQPSAQALAVHGERIVYVGSDRGVRRFIGSRTRVEDAAGRLLLPGLIDSHVHATNIVDLDVCDLKSEAKSLAELAAFVRSCIARYRIPRGDWVIVRQWNPANGNAPDPALPTLRAALDAGSLDHPVELIGNDGHKGAFNSVALARAHDPAGRIVGFSRASLDGGLRDYRHLVGVDAAGEPSGTVNESARALMSVPQMFEVDFSEVMKAPERVMQRLNGAGITGILDPAVRPYMYQLYDTLERREQLTVRAHLAQFFDPDANLTASGEPDWDAMVRDARMVRDKYSAHPLLAAREVKLFADGVLEGNPFAVPPTMPEDASIRPYLQPIFSTMADGKLGVSGYVDTDSPTCADVRSHPDDFSSDAALDEFVHAHGFVPKQCVPGQGKLAHDPAVIREFVKRFHMAGFNVHIHAISDLAIRTSVDAIEAARRADGVSTTHDALAHVQLVHPDDVARIGRDHLYLAFTYSWAYADPEYDLTIVPFFDHVAGNDEAALHPADGYYERNAYPVRSLKRAGAILIAGSDAPVNTRDPQPFVNMAMAVTRRLPGHAHALNAANSIGIREALDAYTKAGAEYLGFGAEAGSLSVGKSADLIEVDRDVLALADGGQAERIAETQVLETYFRGRLVFKRP